MNDRSVAIVCALEFERRRIARAFRGRVQTLRSGPGPGAVPPCLRRLHEQGTRRVVLAGLAGGLRAGALCPPVAGVIDRHARAWKPTMILAHNAEPTATVLGVDQPILTPDDKAALAVAHEADLVDCESHAFAETASALGMTWAVVRAVSDGPRDVLPPQVLAWTDPRGMARTLRLVADLARHPSLIRTTVALARRSARAMDAVCRRLDEAITAMERVTSD